MRSSAGSRGAPSCPRVAEQRGQAEVEEVDRLALELALPRLVALEDRPGQAPNEPWLRKTTSGSSRKLAQARRQVPPSRAAGALSPSSSAIPERAGRARAAGRSRAPRPAAVAPRCRVRARRGSAPRRRASRPSVDPAVGGPAPGSLVVQLTRLFELALDLGELGPGGDDRMACPTERRAHRLDQLAPELRRRDPHELRQEAAPVPVGEPPRCFELLLDRRHR